MHDVAAHPNNCGVELNEFPAGRAQLSNALLVGFFQF